jgi:hypothetical protein
MARSREISTSGVIRFHNLRHGYYQIEGVLHSQNLAIFVGTPAPAPPAPVLNLDWDSDPRLVDLSRALQALGWTPPC